MATNLYVTVFCGFSDTVVVLDVQDAQHLRVTNYSIHSAIACTMLCYSCIRWWPMAVRGSLRLIGPEKMKLNDVQANIRAVRRSNLLSAMTSRKHNGRAVF